MVLVLALNLIGIICLIALVCYAIYKIRLIASTVVRSHASLSSLDARLVEHFQQLQYLRTLERELDLPGALPPTRGWAASPDFLLYLARHILSERPAVILECGGGTSTVAMARAIQLSGCGHLYTLEHQAIHRETLAGELKRLGLQGFVTLIHAPLEDYELAGEKWSWYGLSDLPQVDFDLVVIDGPPANVNPLARFPAGPLLVPRLSRRGTIFLDDAERRGEREILRRWQLLFPDLVTTHAHTEKGCAIITR